MMFIKPKLNPGEEYAGIILGKGPASDYHLILLPGEAIPINWSEAKAWAKIIIGGDLPNRCEQSLLYANLKDEFKTSLYWSGEESTFYSGNVWFQDFDDGSQRSAVKMSKIRARAVRREVIR